MSLSHFYRIQARYDHDHDHDHEFIVSWRSSTITCRLQSVVRPADCRIRCCGGEWNASVGDTGHGRKQPPRCGCYRAENFNRGPLMIYDVEICSKIDLYEQEA